MLLQEADVRLTRCHFLPGPVSIWPLLLLSLARALTSSRAKLQPDGELANLGACFAFHHSSPVNLFSLQLGCFLPLSST